MKKGILLFVCLLILALCGCQVVEESGTESRLMPQINPYSGDEQNETRTVTLYFPVTGEEYLSAYIATVDVHSESGDTLTEALLRALAKGPEQELPLDEVFTDDLKKVSVYMDGDVLNIVLSNKMLTLGEDGSDSALRKQLVLYSIVNTMTANIEDLAQVQILVDVDGNGRGEVPMRVQLGFSDASDEEMLGPLSFSNAWLWTPSAAAQTVLRAGMEKDAARMIRLSGQSILVPDENTLMQQLQSANVLIVDFHVTSTILSADNAQATVLMDITYEMLDSSVRQAFNQAVTLRRESGVWKVDFASVEALLFP